MAIPKKGLFFCGLAFVVLAAGGICAVVLPDALSKEESSATTDATSSEDPADSDQAPDSYQSVMSSYYTAFVKNDPETLYHLMAPEAYWDYYMETYDKTEDDVLEIYEQAIANTMASWREQCGTDVTVSFAITGMSEQSDEFLTEWTDDMNEMFGEEKVHAEDAVTLKVERTLEGSSDTITEIVTPTLIQVDGTWYILQEDATSEDTTSEGVQTTTE